MNIFALAFRNIRLNRKKYVMYLFSMGFSVFTVYTFLALMQNKYVKLAFQNDSRYQMLLTSFGVIIMVFVLFFLISSNNSFVRARKKEISTYALFGMTNLRIGKLLFLETLMAGTATLAVGIGAGVFFSKLTAMFLLDLCLTNFVGDVSFTIDPASVSVTALLFFVTFCFMGLSALRVIHKFELVDLFKADKISEGKYKGSVLVLLLSLALIAAGYIIASGKNPSVVVLGAIPVLILVITGTYLFFWGGLPKVLGIVRKNKKVYYQGANLISVSMVSHRMKSIASVMATIAVLSAVAATAIATGFTLYSNAERNAYNNTGFDLVYYGGEASLSDKLHDVLQTDHVNIDREGAITLYEATPKTKTVIVGERKHLSDGDPFRVYSESEYNKLIAVSKTDLEPASIPSGKAYYIFPFSQEGLEEAMLGLNLDFGGSDVRIEKIIRSSVLGFSLDHTLILNDQDYEALVLSGQVVPSAEKGRAGTATFMNFKSALGNRQLNDQLGAVLNGKVEWYKTAYLLYNESMVTFGLICFIGFFMSGVFILMTASLLYFKQIMAAGEESHQYRMLRRIGMDYKTERQVVRKRLVPVFFIPLAVGIVHSVFAMKTADTVVFSNMIPVENSYLSVLGFSAIMYLAYALVYCVFYFITKSQYERIIR
ncbi:MAG TPA: ABC transporter permease [Anaerovoracaceae bacterium]|nr:ABC transporter permease [Anaerovoracaceae bacterium]